MYGKKVHSEVLAKKETTSGASVHVVTEEYDKGAIIAQSVVPVLNDDNIDTLASRVFKSECELYPWALKCYQSLGFKPPNQPKMLGEIK